MSTLGFKDISTKLILSIVSFAVLVIINNLSISCGDPEVKPIIRYGSGSQDTKDSAIAGLTDNQKTILSGAKKCLAEKFSYDMEMAYSVLTYKDGKDMGEKVYPGGDIDPRIGVCTDLTIRALRYAEVVDLQKAMHEDIVASWSDYPMKRWGARKPDTNIDHRRVPNQLIWFRKYWLEPEENDFKPGDIIIWDIDGDKWADHMGIVSDRVGNENFCVIHNFPSPGYVAEEDVLSKWETVGHFRISY